jgi:hypothetical protein
MLTNTLGDLRVLRAEMDARYGRLSGHHQRPTSSLTVIARVMRRQRWAEEHPGQVR